MFEQTIDLMVGNLSSNSENCNHCFVGTSSGTGGKFWGTCSKCGMSKWCDIFQDHLLTSLSKGSL